MKKKKNTKLVTYLEKVFFYALLGLSIIYFVANFPISQVVYIYQNY